jgi:hypothetical protein
MKARVIHEDTAPEARNPFTLPETIVHNYDPARGPFRNICALAPEQAERILAELRASCRPTLKANYLERRLATERWLYAERCRKLGPPRLSSPIYFFLGNAMADGLDASRPRSIELPLSSFDPDMLTFTYSDSMASWSLGTQEKNASQRESYHGVVFTLGEVEAVVREIGLPDKHERPSRTRPVLPRFIEVQAWDDTPLRPLVDRFGSESPGCPGSRSHRRT